MKKTLLSTLIVASSLIGLASCNGGGNTSSAIVTPPTSTVTEGNAKGDFFYESHGNKYGYVVDVTVAEGKISALTIDTDAITTKGYTVITNFPGIESSWPEREEVAAAYDEAIGAHLAKFVGKDAEAIYNQVVAGVSIAATESKDVMTIAVSDSFFTVTTGATQTNARLAYAIANGIASIIGKDQLVVTPFDNPNPDDPSGSGSNSTVVTTL